MSLSGCKNTQRRRLGAHRSLKVICRRDFRNFLKCYMYCMFGPSLHRQSTDCLILVPNKSNIATWGVSFHTIPIRGTSEAVIPFVQSLTYLVQRHLEVVVCLLVLHVSLNVTRHTRRGARAHIVLLTSLYACGPLDNPVVKFQFSVSRIVLRNSGVVLLASCVTLYLCFHNSVVVVNGLSEMHSGFGPSLTRVRIQAVKVPFIICHSVRGIVLRACDHH